MNTKALMRDAMDDFEREMREREDEERYRWASDLDAFHADAQRAIQLLRDICERSRLMGGPLSDLQASALGTAFAALNELFPDTNDHQDEGRPF